MMRNDPLVQKVLAYCRRWDMLPQGGTVLCALSGGLDSMTLLHILSILREETGFQVAAAHFHHGLRAAADRDQEFVRDWCRRRGVPLACGRGDTLALARREGLSVEDAARKLRYAFLEEAAADMGADRTATAHHREDNAETLLLHLLRGAGTQGLGGIPPVRGRVVRPLLEVSRGEIEACAARNGIPHVEDETNGDAAYTRNRVRLEVLPLLEEISPGCAGRIAAAAVLLREENAYLQREAEKNLPVREGNSVSLPASLLEEADPVIRRRLVRGGARELGVSLTQRQTESALALKNGGYLDFSENLRGYRERERLVLQRQPPPPPAQVLYEGEQIWGSWRVRVERKTGLVDPSPRRAVLRDTGGRLSIASWDGGERLAVENGKRTVKRLCMDAGLSIRDRGEHPAVLVDGGIAAVIGAAVDWRLRPEEGKDCWVISLEETGRDPIRAAE